jgi:glycosyltransferase 2 family protein
MAVLGNPAFRRNHHAGWDGGIFIMETGRLANLQEGRREPHILKGLITAPVWRKLAVLRFWPILFWTGIFGLLYVSFRQVPFSQISILLGHVRPLPLLGLLLINLVFLYLIALRWKTLLHSLGWDISTGALMVYRLAGYAVSYFTPGPQFGGEPVQVHLLTSRKGVPLDQTISSVFMDRLVELISNFTFLLTGSLVVARSGLAPKWLGNAIGILSFSLFLLPVAHILALRLGKAPLSWLTNRLRWAWAARFRDVVHRSERQLAGLVTEKPTILITMIALSVLAWGVAFIEFWLCLLLLGVEASLVQAVIALTAARLAFLLPSPGGLGTLEASQVFAAQLLGWGAAAGITVSLIIRARDVFLATLGLGVGLLSYRSFFLQTLFLKKRKSE